MPETGPTQRTSAAGGGAKMGDADNTPAPYPPHPGGGGAGVGEEVPLTGECWACATVLKIPQVEGRYAADFKCGWCGAITLGPRERKGMVAKMKGNQCCKTCSRLAFKGVSKLVVVIVIGLIGSIIGLGIYTLFPLLILQSLLLTLVNSAVTVFLSFNVFFNYAAAIWKSPGHPDMDVIPKGEDVPRGVFEDCTFCRHCQKPKPSNTHHCSTCRRCIVDMDHHCPFIDNCIGVDNVRSFILFLIFATAGCGYVLCLAAVAVWAKWAEVITFRAELSTRLLMVPSWSFSLQTVLHGLWAVESAFRSSRTASWILPVAYLVIAAGVVFLAVGFLLQSQMSLLLAGYSYIDSLKGVDHGERPSRMQCLRRVFGSGHPMTWCLPRISIPPGAERSSDVLKKDG